MPLDPQRTSFPIVGGQEQDVAPELIDPPMFDVAHNCVYTRPGELRKRNGWRSESEDFTDLPQPEKLLTRGNELVWIGESRTLDGTPLRIPCCASARVAGESFETSPGTPWSRRGEFPRFNVRKLIEFTHSIPNARITHFDCAYAGSDADETVALGVVLCIWKYDDPATQIDYAVIDVATSSIVASGTIATAVSANGQIRCVAALHVDEWYFHVLYGKGGSDWTSGVGNVYWARIAAGSPRTVIDEGQWMANVNGFDVSVTDIEPTDPTYPIEHRLFFLWTEAATRNAHVTLMSIDEGGLLFGQSTAVCDAPDGPTGATSRPYTIHSTCDPDGRHVAATWTVNAGSTGASETRIAAWDCGNATTRTITNVDASQACGNNQSPAEAPLEGGMQIGWMGTGNTHYDRWKLAWATSNAIASDWGLRSCDASVDRVTVQVGTYGFRYDFDLRTWSRIWNYRGQPYVCTLRGCSPDVVVLEVMGLPSSGEVTFQPRVAGRALAGEIAFPTGTKYGRIRGRNSVVESKIERGRFFTLVPTVSSNAIDSRLTILDISAVDPQQYNSAEIAGCLYLAAGVPWCYDGGQGHEIGFSHRPQHNGYLLGGTGIVGEINALAVDSTDPPQTEGDYMVALTWEATDASGKLAQSAPSYAANGTVTVGAAQRIRLLFQTLGYSSRDNVRPVVWVSADAGLNYYRSLEVIDLDPSTDETHQIDLDPAMMFVAGAPKLYTSDGIVENDPLPPMRFACAWQNRLWFANDFDIWFSREVLDGEEPAFNKIFSLKMPVKCSGIAALDDRVVLFGENSIYWTSGDGPTDTGQGASFNVPQLAISDIGCVNARSIVRTQKGIVFQSRRGIELLDRGMNLRDRGISGGVNRYLRDWQMTEILSASLDPEFQIVRFVAKRKGSLSGIILCWHVTLELWTTSSFPTMVGAGRSDECVGIVRAFDSNWMAVGDTEAYLSEPLCYLARESRTSHCDGPWSGAGYGYIMSVETANIKLDGLLGFSRIWRAYCLVKDRGSGRNETGFAMGYEIDFNKPNWSFFTADTPNARVWLTPDDLAQCATDSWNHWRFQIHIDRQQCSAIRLKFSDAFAQKVPVPVDTTLTLVGFGIEWGREPGTGRGAARSKK